jgi:outer membrane protein OmpA-like peptidoglycan-associated protein
MNSASRQLNHSALAVLFAACCVVALEIPTAATSAETPTAAITARPLEISAEGTVVDPAQLAAVTSPDELPDSSATISIDVHEEWCHLSATVADNEAAQQLSYLVGDVFARRCYSDELRVDQQASGLSLPFSLDRLADILQEFASANRPMRLEWFAEDRRLVLSGESFGNVTRAAIELRLRMAMANNDTQNNNVAGVRIDNNIAVVDAPRAASRTSEVLGLVIERDFAGADIPMLTEVQLHPIYFSRRDGRVDSQEMPKLIDIVDQLSTLRPIEECPPMVITGYIFPRGDIKAERAASLRRASAVRNQLVELGIPGKCLSVEAVEEIESLGLTWRSGRVEIRIAEPVEETEEQLVSSEP